VTVVRALGASAGAAPLFVQPQKAVRGPDGLIYVADTGNHRIAVVDERGKVVRTITRGPSGPLQSPYGLAFAPNGRLYVLDSDLGQVLEYATGTSSSDAPLRASAAALSLGHARDLAITKTGQILIADPAGNSVVTLSSDLALVRQQSNRAVDGTDLYEQPDAIATGPNGTIYVVDSQNNQVKQYSSRWRLLRSWPAASTDTLHAPHLLLLAGDRLLVSDPPDNKLLLFSGGSATPRTFTVPAQKGVAAQPLGLAHGPHGTILVTCNAAAQILEVRLPGVH
jgi:DNA-binding beta-propeller fold protein YncE